MKVLEIEPFNIASTFQNEIRRKCETSFREESVEAESDNNQTPGKKLVSEMCQSAKLSNKQLRNLSRKWWQNIHRRNRSIKVKTRSVFLLCAFSFLVSQIVYFNITFVFF
jgi:hypothetical protein